LLGSPAMSQGRQGVILWSIAGAMLFVAGVFVVVAMRPSPLALPASDGSAADAETDVAASLDRDDEAPRHAQRPLAEAPRAAPVASVDPPAAVVLDDTSEEGEPEASAPPASPAFAPLVPPAIGELRDVRLAVPMAEVVGGVPGARSARPPVQEQRLDGMEGIVAGQEAEIRRLEESLAEAERTGNIDDARLRRGRLAQMRRVHGGLEKQLTRMRAEAASTTNGPPDTPERAPVVQP
jgi:hypothetical protein